MRTYTTIITLFFINSIYSQSKDIYFLINKKDTLIEKRISTKNNSGRYLIIDETRIKKLNRTPVVEGKVWVPESDDDFYHFGPYFNFYRREDKIISKEHLDSLNVIMNRKKFLKADEGMYDLSGNRYYFIEPMCNGKFILREVFPIVH